jgi:hypothetical protein
MRRNGVPPFVTLTILHLDIKGYIRQNGSSDASWQIGGIMPENDSEAVAEFIRTKGITRCPTACLVPTQGLVASADRVALEEHAVARDSKRRAQIAARARAFWNFKPHR